VPVLCCPAEGDMAENGARVAWAGAGLSLPWRLTRKGPVRWAVRRLLSQRSFTERAKETQAWASASDGSERGAIEIEHSVAR
jgi:UDP:flavonoid glycosyltransferase YjiC (YdhE family)